METTNLTQIIADLKANLDMYLEDAKRTAKIDSDPTTNEWALQIADIYEAAHGEKLDLTQLTLE